GMGMPMGGMMGMGGMGMPMGGAGGGSSGGTGGTSASCPTSTFVDLTAWLPDQNAAYEDPTLSVTCSGSTMTVTSNSVPQYKITWSDPSRHSYANTLTPGSSTYTIPRTTVFNAVLKQATVVGGVGVAVNGIQIFSFSVSGGVLEYVDPAGI